jgi:hypothetical protein
MKCLARLWREEDGFVVTSDLVLTGGVLVIGVSSALAALRDQVVEELHDVSAAVSDLNQGYSFAGIRSASASTAGSNFTDQIDFADPAGDPNINGGCTVLSPPTGEL